MLAGGSQLSDNVIIITTFHNKQQSRVFALLADRFELQVRCFSGKMILLSVVLVAVVVDTF